MTFTESSKVTASHLSRGAFLYVRQSTLRQVVENQESTQRQYALRQRAVARDAFTGASEKSPGRSGYEPYSRPLRAFVRGYYGRDLAAFRRARAYFRRRSLWMGLRTFWSSRR